MLTPFDVNEFQTKKEDTFFDRKSARKEPKEILKHLIGFANASGGTLIIGIEDDGEITGFKHPKAHSLEDFLNALITHQRIPLPIKHYVFDVTNSKNEADQVLVFEISPAQGRVIEANDGKVYFRSSDETLTLNFEQRLQLSYEKGERSFEDQIVSGAKFDNDLDLALLEEYRQKLKTDRTIEQVLQARNLMNEKGELTNACILLFGNNPTRFFPNARIRFLRYDGKEQLTGTSFNVVKEFIVTDPIPKLILRIKDIMKTQLREFQKLEADGTFKRIDEYPEFAWFEGIVNAVAHRNYSMQGDCIRISMFDDRLEIFSPGGLPRPVTVENIRHTRMSRNSRIAQVMYGFEWVRELNEGVNRMAQEMEDYALKSPSYIEINENSVTLILENNIEHRTLRATEQLESILTQELMATLSENELKVVHFAYDNRKVTNKDVAEHLSKGSDYTRKLLKTLVAKNILVWHGTNPKDPTQYFELRTK